MNTSATILIPIAVGGALGAVLRYLVAVGTQQLGFDGFPYATLTVNVVGSFAIGILFVLIVESSLGWENHRAPIIIGLLGSFTTFSTFSLDTVHLMQSGEMLKAGLNVGLNVALCIIACVIGLALARNILSV